MWKENFAAAVLLGTGVMYLLTEDKPEKAECASRLFT